MSGSRETSVPTPGSSKPSNLRLRRAPSLHFFCPMFGKGSVAAFLAFWAHTSAVRRIAELPWTRIPGGSVRS
jgi:hypothetical protein